MKCTALTIALAFLSPVVVPANGAKTGDWPLPGDMTRGEVGGRERAVGDRGMQ